MEIYGHFLDYCRFTETALHLSSFMCKTRTLQSELFTQTLQTDAKMSKSTETYRRGALTMIAVCQNLIEGHSKGPNIRGKGKLALLQALYGIPKKQKKIMFWNNRCLF